MVAGEKAFGPGLGFIVQVPVKGLREKQSLSSFKTKCMDVGDVQIKSGQLDPRFIKAEFMRLLDGVDLVRSRACKAY